MAKKCIIISGGAGFLGSNLAEKLAKDNRVIVVDNLITGKEENLPKGIEFRKQNIEDFLTGNNVDEIYHLASPASPPKYQKYPLETALANTAGTLQMLELARNSKAKMVFTSTSEIYGNPLEHPQKETYWGNVNILGDRSCYDESKRFGETLCYIYARYYNTNIKIARIFNTYGPKLDFEDGRVIINFILQALDNKPLTIYGNGKQTRSYCYVDDTINGLLALMERGYPGTAYNIGNPNEITVKKTADIIKDLINSKSEFEYLPLPNDDPVKRKPDITKAQKYLDWQPQVSFKEGLEKMIKWVKKERSEKCQKKESDLSESDLSEKP